MTRAHKPNDIVYSNGKPYHITSSGDYVPHDPAKYQAKRVRSARKGGVDRREMTI